MLMWCDELHLKMAYTAHIGIQILIPAKNQNFSFAGQSSNLEQLYLIQDLILE